MTKTLGFVLIGVAVVSLVGLVVYRVKRGAFALEDGSGIPRATPWQLGLTVTAVLAGSVGAFLVILAMP